MAVTRYREVIHMTAQDDAVTGEVLIQGFHYSGATTAGHIAEITEDESGSDKVIAHMTAVVGGNDRIWLECPIRVNGFTLSDLDSGEVTVYLA